MSSLYTIYSAYCVVTKQRYIGFDSTEYKFYNTETGEILYCTRWVFYHNHKISKGCVSNIINKGIVYKNWCVLLN